MRLGFILFLVPMVCFLAFTFYMVGSVLIHGLGPIIGLVVSVLLLMFISGVSILTFKIPGMGASRTKGPTD